MSDRAQAIRIIRHSFPAADDIRFEGKCHVCKRETMYSMADEYSKTRVNSKGEIEESCGYMCVNCKWSNAGSRAYLP